jgi:indole-3-glycerol phosphate synthase
VGKLSQAIAEGDGITIIVEVEDAPGTHAAVKQGADAVACRRGIHAVRAASQVPLLAFGSLTDAKGVGADAIAIAPHLALFHEAQAYGLESVVRVTDAEGIGKALGEFNPEVFLLSPDPEAGKEDPLAALLELLHDVPAGKLAIAELHDATPDEVAELERSGVDAVLVSPGDLSTLVPKGPPEV